MQKGNTMTIVAIAVVVLLVGGVLYWKMQDKAMVKDESMMPTAGTAMPSGSAMPTAEGVMVGGALMTPNRDIVTNALDSKDHTTLVAAVKAAGLVATLQSAGPFTVFAPTNEAFMKLPAGTVDTLLKPENKATLVKILTYHVVSGKYRAKDLKDGMTLKTVEGENLTVKYQDSKWWLMDAKGGTAQITIADIVSTNGVTFVIDSVLMPK